MREGEAPAEPFFGARKTMGLDEDFRAGTKSGANNSTRADTWLGRSLALPPSASLETQYWMRFKIQGEQSPMGVAQAPSPASFRGRNARFADAAKNLTSVGRTLLSGRFND